MVVAAVEAGEASSRLREEVWIPFTPRQASSLTFLRAGGKHFSRNLRPLDADGNEISIWAVDSKKAEEEEESSEEESEEESEDESGRAGPSHPEAELTREERKKQKAAQKAAAIEKRKKAAVQVGDMPSDSSEESEDDMPANPNHSKAARDMTRAQPSSVDEATEGMKKLSTEPMSRREREALEAQKARERYRKLQEAGKTDEARADLARLREIREKREAEAARRQVCHSAPFRSLELLLIGFTG